MANVRLQWFRKFRTRESAVLNLFTKLVAPYVADPRSTARQLLALLDGLRLQWLRADQGFDVVSEWVRAVTALIPEFAMPRKKQRVRSDAKATAVRRHQALKSTRRKHSQQTKRR